MRIEGILGSLISLLVLIPLSFLFMSTFISWLFRRVGITAKEARESFDKVKDNPMAFSVLVVGIFYSVATLVAGVF